MHNYDLGSLTKCQNIQSLEQIGLSQNLKDPVWTSFPLVKAKELCRSVIWGTWRYCYGNEGQAGSLDVGCLRYELRPEHYTALDQVPDDTILPDGQDPIW